MLRSSVVSLVVALLVPTVAVAQSSAPAASSDSTSTVSPDSAPADAAVDLTATVAPNSSEPSVPPSVQPSTTTQAPALAASDAQAPFATSSTPSAAPPLDEPVSAPRLVGLTRLSLMLPLVSYEEEWAKRDGQKTHFNNSQLAFTGQPVLEVTYGVSEVIFVGGEVLAWRTRSTQSGSSYHQTTSSFSVGPAVEIIAMPGSRHRPFVHLAAVYRRGKTLSTFDPVHEVLFHGARVSAAVGVHCFLTRRFALSPAIEYRQYFTQDSDSVSYHTSEVLLTVRAGFFAGRVRASAPARRSASPSIAH